MKKIYVVFVDTNDEQKRFAIAETIKTGENLFAHCHRGTVIAHLCETRQQAEDLAREWNSAYKRNGTFID